jgi:4-amino-4-deoxy-L-arabinose transferase-like glycosyltransferase
MVLRNLAHNPHIALLALIFAVYSSSTVVWTVCDETPPPWDPSDHLRISYDYYRWLAHGEFSSFLADFFYERQYYAPLFHVITALAFLLFGASRLAGVYVNLLSLAVLLLSVDWIARRIYLASCDHQSIGQPEAGSSEPQRTYKVNIAGIVAALLAASYHFSAWLLNYAFLDYALMAVTAGAFALLIRAGDFLVRREAILFGVVAGLGMLTKQTFPLFFVLPGIYVAMRVLRSRNKAAVLNLTISAAIMTGIAAIWYIPHIHDIVEIFKINRQAAVSENEAPVYSLMSNVHYLYGLISSQIQMPFSILFTCGLIYSLLHHRKESVILYLWILSGICVFTFLPNKDLRYTVPVLPAVALISLSWAGNLRLWRHRATVPYPTVTRYSKRAIRRTIVRTKWAVIVTVMIWSFLSFFNAQWPQSDDASHTSISQFRWTVLGRNYYQFDRRPLANDWNVSSIVYTVADSWSQLSHEESSFSTQNGIGGLPSAKVERPTLGVIVNLPYLNPSGVALYSRLLAPSRADPPLVVVEWIVSESMMDNMDKCDYVLVRTGLESADRVEAVEMEVGRLIRSSPERFTKLDSFPLPLGDAEAVIYRFWK